MKRFLKNLGLYLVIQIGAFIVVGYPMIYFGPFKQIKENWVLTAMTTMNHQYLAKLLATQTEIDEIVARNQAPEDNDKVNIEEISINKDNVNDTISDYSYPGAKEIFNEDGVRVETFRESKFKAYVAIIDDPSRVKVATTENLGSAGEKLTNMTERYGAVLGINAGGFVDDGGRGNGGTPLGVVIEDSQNVFYEPSKGNYIVGFNQEDVMVLGNYKSNELSNINLRDAITFRPFLIVNGNPQITEGNGGWGIAPRTAIGQRKDGAIIMLVIDGRQASSVGATLREVQDIMALYGAYNCSNLDGGSSSQMVLNNNTINKTSSSAGPRNLATAFIVEKR